MALTLHIALARGFKVSQGSYTWANHVLDLWQNAYKDAARVRACNFFS